MEASGHEGFDAGLSRFCQALAACTQAGLAEAAFGVVESLCVGLRPWVRAVQCEGSALTLQFAHSLKGEFATRSRVPVELKLEPTLRFVAEVGADSLSVRVEGFSWGPIEGAEEAFAAVAPIWAQAGTNCFAERARLAWEWWKQGASRDYEQTKMWRLITSLVDHKQASWGLPYAQKGELLLGTLVSAPWKLCALRFSRFNAEKIQVAAKKVPLTAGPERELREAGSLHLLKSILNDSSGLRRAAAERLVTSAWNWAMLVEDLNSLGSRAAAPAAVCRILSGAKDEEMGGASYREVATGSAQLWQRNDPTFKLSGPHAGRVVWVAVREDQRPLIIQTHAAEEPVMLSIEVRRKSSDDSYTAVPAVSTDAGIEAHGLVLSSPATQPRATEPTSSMEL